MQERTNTAVGSGKTGRLPAQVARQTEPAHVDADQSSEDPKLNRRERRALAAFLKKSGRGQRRALEKLRRQEATARRRDGAK